MVTALECFLLFFTDTIIGDIVRHTNSYAWGHVAQTSCTTYTNPDGSWNGTNIEEIKRLIALLIHFGLVKVGGQCSNYWSTKTLYNGLWARGIMSRKRYKAPMAFLHVVDPDEEIPGDKLRKINSFIEALKERCRTLYQHTQNVAIDERMVRSRHRSGIRQYIKDKPTKWGMKLWVQTAPMAIPMTSMSTLVEHKRRKPVQMGLGMM